MSHKVSRRGVLRGAGVLGGMVLVGCDPAPTVPSDAGAGDASTPQDAGRPPTSRDAGPAPTGPFQLGVASGDPLPSAVMLWTRVTLGADVSATVRWEVSGDATFASLVTSGEATTDASRDGTVKVDATGLEPATTYYYRFVLGAAVSPVGRTRTAPAEDAAVARMRLAVCACASGAHGYFHAYRDLAQRADLDLVVHLGDVIYEYATGEYGDVRAYDPPHEIITLEDYRRRYAWYRQDPDLREVHRQHPWVTVWDDHETADNAWRDGAGNHDPATEGAFAARKAAAQQAYDEWMPLRSVDPARIWRSLRFGRLAELVLLDTRIEGRSEQGVGDPATRTLLSADQEAFVLERLRATGSQWKLLGNQVMFAPLPQISNVDQWDGYPAQRSRVLEALRTGGPAGARVQDVVVLTGDIHTSWAMEVPSEGAGGAPAAVEFVAPGITSPGFPEGTLEAALRRTVMRDAPYVKFVDLVNRGFYVLDLTPERAEATFHRVMDVTLPYDATVEPTQTWVSRAGTSRLERAEPTPAPTGAPALAP